MTTFGPVRFEDGQPLLLGGLRQRHTLSAAESGIADQWRRFFSGVEVPGRVGSSFYGVMCGSDAASLEYMCAVEVASLAALPEGIGRMRVLAQRYAVFAHHEATTSLGSTWRRILDWLASGDYASAHKPDFELYRADAPPLTASNGIEVWVGVVARDPNGHVGA